MTSRYVYAANWFTEPATETPQIAQSKYFSQVRNARRYAKRMAIETSHHAYVTRFIGTQPDMPYTEVISPNS